MRRPLLLAFPAIAALVLATSASAAALRPDKATDQSVCDMGPRTNEYLGRKMLVPAAASHKDQVDAFVRLAAKFVVDHCGDGQVLVLQGAADLDVDDESLTRVANSSCTVADVLRSTGTGTRGSEEYPTFELRCPISKHAALKQYLADVEAKDPMTSLQARLANAAHGSLGPSNGATSSQKKDCGKMTLGSLLMGGGCR